MKNTSLIGRVSKDINTNDVAHNKVSINIDHVQPSLYHRLSNKILLLNPEWRLQTFTGVAGDCPNVINEHGYPLEWDLLSAILYRRASVFYSPITNIIQKKDLSLFEIYLLIKSDKFKRQTDKLRTLTDKKENSDYKRKSFNYATFSGVFRTRNDKDLITHSQLIAIDLDHLNEDLQRVKGKVNSLAETVMSFVSPNGDGLKVIFHIDPLEHTQGAYYTSVCQYLTKCCTLKDQHPDTSCKNVSRACFLPSDADVFLNPNLISHE